MADARRNRIGILLLVGLGLPAGARAQQIRGTILDDATELPVALAQVQLLRNDGRVLQSLLSDTLGEFVLPAPRRDSVRVRVERIGYATVTSGLLVLQPAELVTVQVRLTAQAVPVKGITVVARKAAPARLQQFFERAEFNKKMGRGRIWLRADIERLNISSVRQLIDPILYTRRPAAGCRGVTAYVDAIPTRLDDLRVQVQPEDIEGVEIYRDMDIPPEYARGECLVILVWRKPYGEGGRPFTYKRALVAAALVLAVFLSLRLF